MKNLIIYISFLLSCFSYSQDTIPTFSEALKNNTMKYVSKTNLAFAQNKSKEGELLFNSLVNNQLIGTRLDYLTIKNLSSKKIDLKKINKPILLITYATWCVINKGDIPALNKLSKDNPDNLQIVVVFWGEKKDAKKISKEFNKNIIIGHANFDKDEDYSLVYLLKNVLGPSTYYHIDANKKIVDINRISNPYSQKIPDLIATNTSYENFKTTLHKNGLGFSMNP